VRATLVEDVRVVVRPPTGPVGPRIRDAHVEAATLLLRESVRPGERPEVAIERAILLNDEDQVVEVPDAQRRIDRQLRRGGSSGKRERVDIADERTDHADDNEGCPQPRTLQRQFCSILRCGPAPFGLEGGVDLGQG
jgi:hypothetical protein